MFRKKKVPASEIEWQFRDGFDETEAKATQASPDKRRFRIKLPFGLGIGKKDDEDDALIEKGSTTLLDILSPSAIDLTGRDHIEVDGVCHAYLYVTGYGYSTVVGNGWLSSLVEAGEGIGLNFIVKRQPREKVLSKIAKTTMVNRSRIRFC